MNIKHYIKLLKKPGNYAMKNFLERNLKKAGRNTDGGTLADLKNLAE